MNFTSNLASLLGEQSSLVLLTSSSKIINTNTNTTNIRKGSTNRHYGAKSAMERKQRRKHHSLEMKKKKHPNRNIIPNSPQPISNPKPIPTSSSSPPPKKKQQHPRKKRSSNIQNRKSKEVTPSPTPKHIPRGRRKGMERVCPSSFGSKDLLSDDASDGNLPSPPTSYLRTKKQIYPKKRRILLSSEENSWSSNNNHWKLTKNNPMACHETWNDSGHSELEDSSFDVSVSSPWNNYSKSPIRKQDTTMRVPPSRRKDFRELVDENDGNVADYTKGKRSEVQKLLCELEDSSLGSTFSTPWNKSPKNSSVRVQPSSKTDCRGSNDKNDCYVADYTKEKRSEVRKLLSDFEDSSLESSLSTPWKKSPKNNSVRVQPSSKTDYRESNDKNNGNVADYTKGKRSEVRKLLSDFEDSSLESSLSTPWKKSPKNNSVRVQPSSKTECRGWNDKNDCYDADYREEKRNEERKLQNELDHSSLESSLSTPWKNHQSSKFQSSSRKKGEKTKMNTIKEQFVKSSWEIDSSSDESSFSRKQNKMMQVEFRMGRASLNDSNSPDSMRNKSPSLKEKCIESIDSSIIVNESSLDSARRIKNDFSCSSEKQETEMKINRQNNVHSPSKEPEEMAKTSEMINKTNSIFGNRKIEINWETDSDEQKRIFNEESRVKRKWKQTGSNSCIDGIDETKFIKDQNKNLTPITCSNKFRSHFFGRHISKRMKRSKEDCCMRKQKDCEQDDEIINFESDNSLCDGN